MNADYVYNTAKEAEIKQNLATLAGFGDHNLTDYTIDQLIKEVERQEKDYIKHDSQITMHPTVQDAFLYLFSKE